VCSIFAIRNFWLEKNARNSGCDLCRSARVPILCFEWLTTVSNRTLCRSERGALRRKAQCATTFDLVAAIPTPPPFMGRPRLRPRDGWHRTPQPIIRRKSVPIWEWGKYRSVSQLRRFLAGTRVAIRALAAGESAAKCGYPWEDGNEVAKRLRRRERRHVGMCAAGTPWVAIKSASNGRRAKDPVPPSGQAGATFRPSDAAPRTFLRATRLVSTAHGTHSPN
jgi:hypothetical protein